MHIPSSEILSFESAINRELNFLESDFGLSLIGIKTVDEDTRDAYVVAKFRKGEFRVDVAWSPMEMSLGILLRLCTVGLDRRERHVYFEPFVEFASCGNLLPLVPQIYPGMSVGEIERTMISREKLFEQGFNYVIRNLSLRLREQLLGIQESSCDFVRSYHHWYKLRGSSSKDKGIIPIP